jgi:hypothetical protein
LAKKEDTTNITDMAITVGGEITGTRLTTTIMMDMVAVQKLPGQNINFCTFLLKPGQYD